jgi:hypothetical protein
MTREETRRLYVADCDRAIAHPVIVGHDTVDRARALRELMTTSDLTVDQLMAIQEAQKRRVAAGENEEG